MNSPRISIIIPVYQAEQYLARCLDSVLAQTFTDWEVLLIDDGSTDASGKICDSYADRDNRIKVIHQTNRGVSATRQTGNELASGDYTIHVDPDDWIEKDMLLDLYHKAESEQSDMVICDFWWDSGNTSRIYRQRPAALDSMTVAEDLFRHLHGSSCNKLIRREAYLSHGICYPSGLNFCEDLIFNLRLLLSHPLRISYQDKAYYHYVQYDNKNSLSRRYDEDVLESDWRLRDIVMDITKGTACEKASMTYMHSMAVSRSFFSGYFNSSDFRKHFYGSRRYVLRSSRNIALRLLMYLSCIGLYRPIYAMMDFVRKSRYA